MSQVTRTEDTRQRDREDASRAASARISPRGAYRDWLPDMCRNFEDWDQGIPDAAIIREGDK